ncbi:MAG: hypothetical protein PHE89_00815 [Alphaproteobacteria bacterium]|nr:hypothetical protein [Alphaproteobacteria bacterium]
MDMQGIMLLSTFVLSLIASFYFLLFINAKISNQHLAKKSIFAFIGVYLVTFIAFTALYFGIYTPTDFLHNLQYESLAIAFVGGALIFTVYSFPKTEKFGFLAVLLSCAAIYFTIPEDFRIFEENIPAWADKLCIILALFYFSMIYKYINVIDGLLVSQNGTIGIGVAALALIFSIPLLGGFGGIILATSIPLLFFNRYPAKIQISSAGATAFAFVLGWLLLLIGMETSVSCSLILILFPLVEATQALLKKATFLEKYKDINENTFCAQTNIRGLYPDIIRENVTKVIILCVLLACFQIFSTNLYSIPAFGVVAVLWFLMKMKDWESSNKSLSEINKETIESLKDNIDEIKKYIKKD